MVGQRQSPPPFLYGMRDIEQAFGLPARTLEMLVRLELAPNSVTGGGRGKERLFDAEGLAQFALVSAFYWSGFEMVSAGRFAEAIISYFTQVYGRSRISGLYARTHDRKLVEEIERLRVSQAFRSQSQERTDDALIYAAIRSVYNYIPGEVWKYDTYFDLIDREYGFIGVPDGPLTTPSMCGRKDKMQPTFRVKGLERGGDIVITRIEEEYNFGWQTVYPEPSPQAIIAAEIEKEFFSAYDNPLGKLSLNLSRAIRIGHDRIFALRNQSPVQDGGATIGGATP